jgi:hypothetical protein
VAEVGAENSTRDWRLKRWLRCAAVSIDEQQNGGPFREAAVHVCFDGK